MNRGEIYYVNIPSLGGSVEKGYRPVVVVSSRVGLTTSDIVTVAPVTTKIKELSCNVKIRWSAPGTILQSQVLCNQIITLPRHLFNTPQDCVTAQELADINAAIIISLGLRASDSMNAVEKTQEDAQKLRELIPQAKDLIKQLRELVKPRGRAPKILTIKATTTRAYHRLSPEQKEAFVMTWKAIDKYDTTTKNRVVREYGFTSVIQASAAYKRYTAC